MLTRTVVKVVMKSIKPMFMPLPPKIGMRVPDIDQTMNWRETIVRMVIFHKEGGRPWQWKRGGTKGA
jgi:hypothetical protein